MQQSKMSRLSLASVMGYDMPEEEVKEEGTSNVPSGKTFEIRQRIFFCDIYIDRLF